MKDSLMPILEMMASAGIYAPFLFILLHVIRQFLFVPVGFICMAGGVLFGTFYGTIYSVIGVTLVSVLFYLLVKRLPKLFQKVIHTKQRWFGKRVPMSVGQMTILRLLPFVHFHLISLCLIEVTKSFKEYTKMSIFSNFPLAIVYTSLGQWISNLSPRYMAASVVTLAILFYLLRRKEWIIKWNDFFQAGQAS
ncbi:TVP38/TMEM64 family protein [Pseudalkalibacillus caeni]|uniref:TVP38/TMEM64 family membrane protein n=1 Tax=Exobacillus caeni TaxID=2574798 RepID=A0A5R9FE55_9BACL|nr:VTT domain-containing protein [Pseudalkalibacillus caeni]TLS39163.1 TVP38/TMEM64 family protein [Pseudalkalibacillus caeni]